MKLDVKFSLTSHATSTLQLQIDLAWFGGALPPPLAYSAISVPFCWMIYELKDRLPVSASSAMPPGQLRDIRIHAEASDGGAEA